MFNYKDEKALAHFKSVTTNTNKLSACFSTQEKLDVQVEKWMRTLKSFLKQVFKKVRVSNRKKNNRDEEMNILLSRRKEAIETGDEINQDILECNIRDLESKRNIDAIRKHIEEMKKNPRNKDNNVWKMKEKLFPKKEKALPTAKYNNEDQLITNHAELKEVYLEHFQHRLRERPMILELTEYQKEIEDKFIELLASTELKTTNEWKMTDLEKVLRKLKSKQSQDSNGFANEIFQLKNIGDDLKNSLLVLCNKIRKLQCHGDKCHRMHVGRERRCESLFIESWRIDKEYVDGKIVLKDVHEGKTSMKTVNEQLYLGEIITNDCSNEKNVQAKIAKGKGVIGEIIFILNNAHFGSYYFEALKLMRESLFISVITNQSEIWFNTTEKQLRQLESLDANLLSRAFESNSRTSYCVMLLEMGIKPIRHHIKQKRMVYFHKLLTNGMSTLPSQVLQEQMKNTMKGDWYNDCIKDMKDMSMTKEETMSLSIIGMKKALKVATDTSAFEFLLKQKGKQSKGSELFYDSLQMQSYLKSGSKLSPREMKQLFQLRSHNLQLKDNFPNQFTDRDCVIPECSGQDSQRGLFYCNYLEPINTLTETAVEYDDIFSNEISKQKLAMKIIYQKYTSRNKYLASTSNMRTPGDQEDG